MPNGTDDGDARDENAPQPTADDRTERHLVKARQLLREARSRLTALDGDEVVDPSADPETPKTDSEEP